jgi:hypothetical protein
MASWRCLGDWERLTFPNPQRAAERAACFKTKIKPVFLHPSSATWALAATTDSLGVPVGVLVGAKVRVMLRRGAPFAHTVAFGTLGPSLSGRDGSCSRGRSQEHARGCCIDNCTCTE